MLKTKPEILKISPYTPGKSKIAGVENPIKLSSNENGIGCSPKALAAYQNYTQLNRYPDGSSTELRTAIGKVHKLDAEKIICSAGSDEILKMIAYAFSGEGDEVIYTRHGFLVYPIAAQSAGAVPIAVEEKDYTTDVDAIIKAVTPKTRIVFFANPNNPTGTYISKHDVHRLRQGLREDILLVIDSAYAECVTAGNYTDGHEIVDANDNTIMTRTFSKVYGLAALRLGWAYADAKIIDILNRIRPPFNVTAPAIAAGIAAVNDQEFVQKSANHNTKWRDKLFAELQSLDFEPIAGQGNFVTANFGDGKKAFDFLAARGIIVREIANYDMPEYLRISIGTEEEMQKLFTVLREYKTTI